MGGVRVHYEYSESAPDVLVKWDDMAVVLVETGTDCFVPCSVENVGRVSVEDRPGVSMSYVPDPLSGDWV